jgi:uncharacterized Rmd1/YagE family protein
MDCCAFSTASNYAIKPLYEAMRHQYKASLFRDVAYVALEGDHACEAFFFSYGVAIFWGIPKEQGLKLLQQMRPYEHHHTDEVEADEFTFSYGETAKIVEDEITLPNREVLTKLAISQGIAQSVKLGTFENALKKTFDKA